MELSDELINRAKACGTAEELLSLAKENELELTKEDAAAFLEEFKERELADEELDDVSGGSGCSKPNPYEMVYWEKEEDVQFIFNVGDFVEAFAVGCVHHTARCKVVGRRISKETYQACQYRYNDEYQLEKQPGGNAVFLNGWYRRDNIEK